MTSLQNITENSTTEDITENKSDVKKRKILDSDEDEISFFTDFPLSEEEEISSPKKKQKLNLDNVSENFETWMALLCGDSQLSEDAEEKCEGEKSAEESRENF